jgi:TPR repeat protein
VPFGPKPLSRFGDAARRARAGHVRLSMRLARACALAFGFAAGLLAYSGGEGLIGRLAAQQRPSITVAAVTQAPASSRTRLQIQIGPQEAVAKNSFVRIRGLPPAVALSEGHSIAPGAWAIPMAALPNLALILPVGQQGPAEVTISLVSIEGAVLAEAKTSLVITAAPATTRADDPAAGGAPRVPVPRLTPEQRERAQGLHAKGLEQLERGNIYAARKFFELAGEIGLAQSAIAAAGTYDPDELAKLRVVGFQPDVAAARKWYERARELGAVEAAERLRRLGSR